MISRRGFLGWLDWLVNGPQPPRCRVCNETLTFSEDVAKGECWRHDFLRRAANADKPGLFGTL